jgi:hypothetical protein
MADVLRAIVRRAAAPTKHAEPAREQAHRVGDCAVLMLPEIAQAAKQRHRYFPELGGGPHVCRPESLNNGCRDCRTKMAR